MSKQRVNAELLAAATATIAMIEERIKLKQLPIATRMLTLALRAAIRKAHQHNGKHDDHRRNTT
jgi:hypothetical protein